MYTKLFSHHHQSQRFIGIQSYSKSSLNNPIVLEESLSTPHTAATLDNRTSDVSHTNNQVKGGLMEIAVHRYIVVKYKDKPLKVLSRAVDVKIVKER